MKIDDKQKVTMTEATEDFARVARMVEEHGEVFILENDKPRYKIVDLETDTTIEMTYREKLDFVSARLLREYKEAYKELAK